MIFSDSCKSLNFSPICFHMKKSLRLVVSLLVLSLAFNQYLSSQGNIALGKRAGASGLTQGKPPVYITDGNYATSSYPAVSGSTIGFYYELDLENVYNFDKIILYGDMTYDYRLEIFTEFFGTRGDLVWSAEILQHGTTGHDIILSESDPAGEFKGRYIRITNLDADVIAPSIAELEVYEAVLPVIDYFIADACNITQKGTSDLPASALISWQASAYTSISMSPEIGDLSDASGSLNLSPSTTTTYTLTASNNYGTVSKEITIAVDSVTLDPVITEFMASNLATLVDEDGDNPDWIEIYNPNNFSINIKDYYLTDDARERYKWKIPNRVLAPREYAVVFASTKDRTSLDSPLHTNFSLKSEGEFLALVAKDGFTILQHYPVDLSTAFSYSPQYENISYGIDALGKDGYFGKPTPGRDNFICEEGIVEEIQVTPQRGIYNAPVDVAIECATPGAVIRYTTDGSVPTDASGKVYSGPLKLSTTQIIRARAFKTGLIPGKIKTHTYVFVDDVVNSSVMDKAITGVPAYKSQIQAGLAELPTISLVMNDAVNTTTEIATSMEWIDPVKNEDLQLNAGIQNYGGSYTDFDKKNFRLYFRGVYGDTKLRHPLFEGFEHSVPAVEQFDQIELRAGGHDMKMRGFYMSNRFVDDILLESGHLNPHGRFVNVYINGVYWGQYHLRERWNDAMFAEYFDAEKEDFEAINGNLNLGGWSPIEIPYAGDGSAWENVKLLREDYMAVKDYLDVPQYINFMLTFMYGNCENEYRTVGSIYPGNGFKFYFNDADGFTRSAGDRTKMDQPGRSLADGPGSVFSMLLKEAHPDYITLLADQIHKLLFNDGVLTPNRLTSLLNERCTEVQNSIVAECARWGYRTPSNWESAKNSYINSVLPYRSSTVINQFKSAGFYPSIEAPVFSQHGGIVPIDYQLTMSTNTNAIYYTTDGSDPRLSEGFVSEFAYPYSVTGKEYLELVGEKSDVSALVPSNSTLGTSWTSINYDDSENWLKNSNGAGVGYDTESTYVSHIDLSVKDQLYTRQTSVYLRYPFELDDPTGFESLELKMRCDDGFVAYLNGEVIASVNAPANLSWNSQATSSYSDGSAVVFTTMTMTHPDVLGLLKKGSNVLSIHGLNVSANSSDFLIEPELTGTRSKSSNETDYVLINEAVKIKARAFDGTTWSALSEAWFDVSDISAVNNSRGSEDKSMVLVQQYPNPFKNHTTISFLANQESETVLEIIDMLGQRVWVKHFSVKKGIKYAEIIDASQWETGIYFYRLSNDKGTVETGKMIHNR